MINRYSSRRGSLSGSLLNKKLKNAKSYDRIAGYFSSSILEVAGEEINGIEGKVRVVCNSGLDERDVQTAILAKNKMRKEWCDFKPEELPGSANRFKKLYELLSSGKMEVRVLPDKKFGLIHGKVGVITLEDGTKTSFLGSVNESKFGWDLNYELVWEDDSKKAIDWVQEEFDSLWNDKSAVALSDFIIEDIKRISDRTVIETVEDWKGKNDTKPSSTAVESPVYREHLGLWEHQKYFVDLAFKDHKKDHGARYVLADQVGLGKTIQLAMSAQLMALYGDKPVLIIVPKTLIWQWQEEMNTLLDMPSAVWDGKSWIDEAGIEYVNRGIEDIKKCPRKVGIISQGLIVAKSEATKYLLNRDYECIIVDECHRARRKNLGPGKEHLSPEPNNLYEFLLKISPKTKSMLLATATPIQMYPIELWDLMNILSQKNDSVLGSISSYWRKRNKISKGLNLIMGKEEIEFFNAENWEWIRNPFPPSHESSTFASLRIKSNMDDNDFVYKKSFTELSMAENHRIGVLLTGNFYNKHNPYIRHVIRRERKYLEETINPETNEAYLKKIEVELRGEDDEEALILSSYLKEAYEYAEEFCEELGKRSKSSGFLKTLLLKRIGSSMEAGRNTGLKMLNNWNTSFHEVIEEEEEESKKESDIKNLTKIETELLEKYVRALETNEAIDPKYDKTVELLKDENWIERGTIIFSQYFDTAKWIAENLSKEFNGKTIGLYAGGSKSGIFIDGIFKRKEKEDLKLMVRNRDLSVLVGTDSASEGLNLQSLGTLINIDLPWNPTRLEQRKGRIQRIGQIYDTIYVYNMRYKDSVEDRVHSLLSKRLKNIYNVFGQLPDVLEDAWINIAIGEKDKAFEIIDNVPKKHPFENRYNIGVNHIDWESCSEVLDKKEKRKYLEMGW
ncbi:phospholipase D-like domain-containing anti-phage protein [Senegalia sp. (in: firmicutes)]|uniref:phospholipase D-like domain-containing anti-phage protein n=2 Tax=Bacillota TaxID=1239 RepID=UPI003F97EB3B